MEALIIGSLVLSQLYNTYMTSKDRKAMLNAVMAKNVSEFHMLQAPKPSKRRKDPMVQDDANIPHGL